MHLYVRSCTNAVAFFVQAVWSTPGPSLLRLSVQEELYAGLKARGDPQEIVFPPKRRINVFGAEKVQGGRLNDNVP
jgi:hypothetical protein